MIRVPLAPIGMSECDGAAVDVELLVRDGELPADRDGLRGERLVELEEVDVPHRQPGRCSAARTAGTGPMPITRGGTPALAYARMRASGVRPSAWARDSLITTTAAPPSLMPLALPAVTLPSLSKAGRSPDSDFGRGPGARMLVGVDGHRLLARLDRDATISSRKRPAAIGRLSLLLRGRGERILVRAAHLVLVGDVLGGGAHVAVLEGAPEAVADHLVDELAVTEPVAVARVLDEVRRARHVLHATGEDHLAVAGADRLRGKRDRLQPDPHTLLTVIDGVLSEGRRRAPPAAPGSGRGRRRARCP